MDDINKLKNENRIEIYELVRKKVLNIQQISDTVGLSYQNTLAHIKILEELKLIRREKQQKTLGRKVLVYPGEKNILFLVDSQSYFDKGYQRAMQDLSHFLLVKGYGGKSG